MSYGNRELSYQKTQTKQPLNFLSLGYGFVIGGFVSVSLCHLFHSILSFVIG